MPIHYVHRAPNPNGYPIDAYGNPVPPTVQRYLIATGSLPNAGTFGIWANNPQYNPQALPGTSPAPLASQFSSKFIFDTIGQTIYRAIGHVSLPLRVIWVLGIENSGDTLATATMTAAYALCAPIDPTEEGDIGALLLGGNVIYDPSKGGVIIPEGMDATTAALMTTAINNIVIYPGDEAQQPAPLIVADKGGSRTPAFRGLRYIIVPGWPLSQGIPSLTAQWNRTNDISFNAVDFDAGDA